MSDSRAPSNVTLLIKCKFYVTVYLCPLFGLLLALSLVMYNSFSTA